MLECTIKRTHKFWLAFFLVTFVAQGVFFATSIVVADTAAMDPSGTKKGWDFTPGPTETATKSGESASKNATDTSVVDNKPTGSTDICFSGVIKCLVVDVLNAFNTGLGFIAGGAAGLFVWIVQPENITGQNGIMNKASVYELWKFIRDFFNVFFILILLLSAFATVFQVENFSIRKIFLNILLAALVINFSFPITRLLIDLTNVPMYYFLNAILPGKDGGTAFTQSFLGSTGMSGIQTIAASDISRALINTVFTFLFMISLFVLALLFLIRFIALTLLLIFSPIGFAASLMPGMHGMGSKWWEEFWRYSLFGPSAALMLLVAMRFQNEIASDGTVSSFQRVNAAMTAGTGESSSLALVAFYTIPLVLIWITIGMANKSSIAGAGLVVGLGQGAARKVGGWAKKGGVWVGTHNPVANTAKGLGKGIKDRAMDSRLAKWAKSPSYFESGAKGLAKGKGWTKGVESERDKYYLKQINEKITKNKEEKISRSAALKDTESTDLVTRVAGAASLAQMDNGIQTMDDLTKALNALNDPKTGKIPELYKDRATELVSKTDKKIIAATKDPSTGAVTSGLQNLNKVIGVLGVDNKKAISDLIGKLEDTAFTGTGADWDPLLKNLNAIDTKLSDDLKTKMIKEGGAKILVEHAASLGMTDQLATETVLSDIRSVKDIVASAPIFQDARYGNHARNFINDPLKTPVKRRQELEKTAMQESSNPSIYF